MNTYMHLNVNYTEFSKFNVREIFRYFRNYAHHAPPSPILFVDELWACLIHLKCAQVFIYEYDYELWNSNKQTQSIT